MLNIYDLRSQNGKNVCGFFSKLYRDRLHHSLLWCHILISFLAFLSSCKPEEPLLPLVTYLEPAVNALFSSGDTIWVKAEVSSEHLVTEVQLDLVNALGTPVSPKTHQYPNSNAFLFESYIVLSALQFTSGPHQLRLWVRDEVTDKRKYLDVQLERAPFKSKGYVLAEYISSQSRALVWLDTNLLERQRDTMQGDHLAVRHLPGNNLIYTCGKVTGSLEARNIPHFDLVWNVSAVPNPPAPYFTFLETGLDRFLLAGFADGFVRVFRPDGQVEETILVKEGCIATQALLTESYLILDEVSHSGPTRFLSIYHYPSGTLFYRIFPGMETKGLFPLAQEVLWIGNTGDGGAEIRKLKLGQDIDNTLLRSLFSEVDAAAYDPNRGIFFAMNSLLFAYNPVGDVLQQFPFIGEVHFLFVDPVMEVLGVVADSGFFLLSLDSGMEIGMYPGNRYIFDACVLLID